MAANESKEKPVEESDAEEVDNPLADSKPVTQAEMAPSVGKRKLAMLDTPRRATTRIDAAAPGRKSR